MIPYVASGLVYGALYAIAALGLVLTYKSSRVFNFAYASIAFAIAMCYYELTIVHEWPIVAALAICLVVIAPLVGMLLTMLVFRHLRHTPVAVQVVATVGLFIAIPATVRFLFGTEPRFDAIGLFRGQPPVYDVLGTSLNLDQIAIIIGAAVIALAFGVILHATRFGLAVRTVVDNEDLAALLGISPRAVDAGTGAISAFTAGVAGILMSPVLGLNEQAFTTLLIASIAATVLGGLRSMGWTFIGAIGIGIAQGVAAKFLPATGVVSQGVRPSIPFIVIFVGLAGYSTYLAATHVSLTAIGQGLGNVIPRRAGRTYRIFWKAAVVVTLVVVVPSQLSGRWIEIWAIGLSTGIVMLSYVLITGQSQLVSLCQVTFAGIGGIVTAQLATEAGWPVILGILAGGVISVPVGLLIALASVRLGPLYLALITLGFAILVDNLIFPQHRFTQLGVGVPVPRPSVFGFDLGTDVRFYFFALATFAVLALDREQRTVIHLGPRTGRDAVGRARRGDDGGEPGGAQIVRLRAERLHRRGGWRGVGIGQPRRVAERLQRRGRLALACRGGDLRRTSPLGRTGRWHRHGGAPTAVRPIPVVWMGGGARDVVRARRHRRRGGPRRRTGQDEHDTARTR